MINRSDGALMKKKKMIAREKEGDSDGKWVKWFGFFFIVFFYFYFFWGWGGQHHTPHKIGCMVNLHTHKTHTQIHSFSLASSRSAISCTCGIFFFDSNGTKLLKAIQPRYNMLFILLYWIHVVVECGASMWADSTVTTTVVLYSSGGWWAKHKSQFASHTYTI